MPKQLNQAVQLKTAPRRYLREGYHGKTMGNTVKKSSAKKPGPKKKSATKYGKAATKSVKKTMEKKKKGTFNSGKEEKGGKVKSRKQAIAIGLAEARTKGAKVPQKKSS